MKKKKFIFSFSLAMAVLFSILFQSFHSFEHLAKQLAVKECHHQYNSYTKTEVTHHHQTLEVCYVCHFTFSSYVAPTKFVFQALTFNEVTIYYTKTSKIVFSFPGSLYAHRGPPAILS